MDANWYRQNQPSAYFRMLHAVPNAPAVDIYANGKLVAKDLNFKEESPYWSVVPGNYRIEIYPTGEKGRVLIDANLYIPQDSIFNVSIIGTLPNISLYPIPEPTVAQNFGRPCIRFINLSPDSPELDVLTADGRKIFNKVGFKDITDYACVPAGSYTFKIQQAGSNKILFTLPGANLQANNYYSIYALGLTKGTPALSAIIVSEPRK